MKAAKAPFNLSDYEAQAKLSGASGVLRFGPKGVDILSYRRSRVDGRPIIHTQRILGGSRVAVPEELQGTLARGEIYGEDAEGRAIGEQDVSALLNSSLANALRRQEQDKVRLRVALFDVLGHQGDHAARKAVLARLAALDPAHFTLPDSAGTPEAIRELAGRIAGGRHPQTSEGLVLWPKAGGDPLKAKIKRDDDVYVRTIEEGRNRLAGLGAGGFGYSFDPDGPVAGYVGSGLDDALRRDMLSSPGDYIGRVAKVRAPRRTASGALFQPVFLAMHEDYDPVAGGVAKAASAEGARRLDRLNARRREVESEPAHGGRTFRIREGGKVVASVDAMKHAHSMDGLHELLVANLYVDEAYRGRRLAEMVMSKLVEEVGNHPLRLKPKPYGMNKDGSSYDLPDGDGEGRKQLEKLYSRHGFAYNGQDDVHMYRQPTVKAAAKLPVHPVDQAGSGRSYVTSGKVDVPRIMADTYGQAAGVEAGKANAYARANGLGIDNTPRPPRAISTEAAGYDFGSNTIGIPQGGGYRVVRNPALGLVSGEKAGYRTLNGLVQAGRDPVAIAPDSFGSVNHEVAHAKARGLQEGQLAVPPPANPLTYPEQSYEELAPPLSAVQSFLFNQEGRRMESPADYDGAMKRLEALPPEARSRLPVEVQRWLNYRDVGDREYLDGNGRLLAPALTDAGEDGVDKVAGLEDPEPEQSIHGFMSADWLRWRSRKEVRETGKTVEELLKEHMVKQDAGFPKEAAGNDPAAKEEAFRKENGIHLCRERRRDTPSWLYFGDPGGGVEEMEARVRLERDLGSCTVVVEKQGTPDQMRKLDKAARLMWESWGETKVAGTQQLAKLVFKTLNPRWTEHAPKALAYVNKLLHNGPFDNELLEYAFKDGSKLKAALGQGLHYEDRILVPSRLTFNTPSGKLMEWVQPFYKSSGKTNSAKSPKGQAWPISALHSASDELDPLRHPEGIPGWIGKYYYDVPTQVWKPHGKVLEAIPLPIRAIMGSLTKMDMDMVKLSSFEGADPSKDVGADLPRPTRGPEAILAALQGLDTAKVEEEARNDMRIKSRRSKAVKVLNTLEGLKRNKLAPSDYMIRKVPVIPPAFRPFSMQGSVFIPGDANELYRDLVKMRDAYEEEQSVFGEPNRDTFLKLYGAVQAAYGYGDPVEPKTRERGVSGFMKKITGDGSPKYCYDDQTEILTDEGWVLFKDLTPLSMVGSWNPRLNRIEYVLPSNIGSWRHSGPMFSFRCSCMDLVVTAAHRMYACIGGRWKTAEAWRLANHSDPYKIRVLDENLVPRIEEARPGKCMGHRVEQYNGQVHCCEVPSGLLVVRRNGKACVSGNSFFQSKMISKPMDNVARSTVVVDPELSLDEVGVPEELAWNMYKPYIQRRLVQKGWQSAAAVRAIRDRTPEAYRELEAETKVRPVIYSRAPSWHKFNAISGRPKLIKGLAIGVNPLITTGQNMDFDGDQINLHVPSLPESVKEAYEKMMPSKMLHSIRHPEKIMPLPKHEQILGLHNAMVRPSRKVHRFGTEAEALAAIKAGHVPLRDEVEIAGVA
jgi:hypothetical protein